MIKPDSTDAEFASVANPASQKAKSVAYPEVLRADPERSSDIGLYHIVTLRFFSVSMAKCLAEGKNN